jgi:hypothetical protein
MNAFSYTDLSKMQTAIEEVEERALAQQAKLEKIEAELPPEQVASAKSTLVRALLDVEREKHWVRCCTEYTNKGPNFSSITLASGYQRNVIRPMLLGLTHTLRPVWLMQMKEDGKTTAVVIIETVADPIPVAYYPLTTDADRNVVAVSAIMKDIEHFLG